MAIKETDIVTSYMMRASKLGHRLWRNTRGQFLPVSLIKQIYAAARSGGLKAVLTVVSRCPQIRAGLSADGSGDAIGYTMVTITPAMVGKKLPIFSSIEGKTETGTAQLNQEKWMAFLKTQNAITGIARSDQDYEDIIQAWLSGMG